MTMSTMERILTAELRSERNRYENLSEKCLRLEYTIQRLEEELLKAKIMYSDLAEEFALKMAT